MSSSGYAPSTGGKSERKYERKIDTSNGGGASTGPSWGGTPLEVELVKGGVEPFPFVVAMLASVRSIVARRGVDEQVVREDTDCRRSCGHRRP